MAAVKSLADIEFLGTEKLYVVRLAMGVTYLNSWEIIFNRFLALTILLYGPVWLAIFSTKATDVLIFLKATQCISDTCEQAHHLSDSVKTTNK